MARKLSALILAIGLLCLLAGRARAGPREDLVPYSVDTTGPNGTQVWYLANTNPRHHVHVRLVEFDRGRCTRTMVFTINPGDSVLVGSTSAALPRDW